MKKKETKSYVIDDNAVIAEVYEESSFSGLQLTVGTNTPVGGDAGHGGRTILELKNSGPADMRITSDGESDIRITLAGDIEADAFISVLKQSVEVLERQMASNRLVTGDSWDYARFGSPESINDYKVYQYAHIDDLSFMVNADELLKNDKYRSHRIKAAQDVLSAAGWEGDGTLQILWLPPFLCEDMEDCHGVYVWHVKQYNNGTSWVASPVALPFEPLVDQNS